MIDYAAITTVEQLRWDVQTAGEAVEVAHAHLMDVAGERDLLAYALQLTEAGEWGGALPPAQWWEEQLSESPPVGTPDLERWQQAVAGWQR